jgi:O-antigen/teichoic acid export membrane protein
MRVKKQALTGTKWTTLSTIILAIVSIIKLSVLSRFLDSEDFGLMALVGVFIGFITLFMDMGINTAILHVQDIKRKEYYSLYWLNFFFSLILYSLIVLSAPFVAHFYDEPELQALLCIMGFGLILSSLGRQFKTQERKALQFKFISHLDITSGVISLAVAIVLAIYNYGVYALVYAMLAQFFISNMVIFFYGLKQYGLELHFKAKETKRFLKIGIYQLGGQVVNYFNRDLDTLLIGKLLGTEVLGGYSLAKQLVFRPASIINPILTMVGAPTLALLQYDKHLLARNYLKLINVVSSLNFLAYLGIILFAPFIVTLLYGSDFEYIYPIVQILSVYMFLRSTGNPVGSLVIATGRTDLEFYWNIISLLLMPLSIYIGSFYGKEGVAWALSLFVFFSIYPFFKLLITKMIPVSFSEYIKALIPNFNYLLQQFSFEKK